MKHSNDGSSVRRVAVIGGGMSGIGAAWNMHHHPDRFDFRLYEAKAELGGNAVTAHMEQDDGTTIPFDISVTACIPRVYHHVILIMEKLGIDLIDTRFNYSVKYGKGVYAHDFDSDIRRELQPEIEKFQKLLRLLNRFGALNRSASQMLQVLNPFNYISMGALLNLGRFSGDFRYKVLKPMFVNFLMATNVYDMPSSMFARYLEFFSIESATPMNTWALGTQRIYQELTADFHDKIYFERPVKKVYRNSSNVVVEDENGDREVFDDVIFACNANQTFMMLDKPTYWESRILSSIRYESELHNHAIVHWDESVLPDNEVKPLETRSNHIEQYGARPDNYEITYIMHNQQPWANGSVRPCLVTYNPLTPIDENKIIARRWFQHIVHDIGHVAGLVNLFRYIQGRRRTWYCGAHTLVNCQEHCFMSGLITTRQMGADYPFNDDEARKWFNFFGRLMFGFKFKKVKK